MYNKVKKGLGVSRRHRLQETRKVHLRFPRVVRQKITNAVTLTAMDNALAGRDIHGPFDSVQALMADLNA